MFSTIAALAIPQPTSHSGVRSTPRTLASRGCRSKGGSPSTAFFYSTAPMLVIEVAASMMAIPQPVLPMQPLPPAHR